MIIIWKLKIINKNPPPIKSSFKNQACKALYKNMQYKKSYCIIMAQKTTFQEKNIQGRSRSLSSVNKGNQCLFSNYYYFIGLFSQRTFSKQDFFTADILKCHNRKCTGVINNSNDDCISFQLTRSLSHR